ncbi:hypothetical protein [Amycolatopsis lurida]|uniref:hypothetical protein n=1 Tax=Amycolatopsis lurida TaxID=31959 RepID=UPI003651B609
MTGHLRERAYGKATQMKFCSPKIAHVVWDGTNEAEVLEFCAPILFEGTSYAVSFVGEQMRYTDAYGVEHVLLPGTALVNYGAPSILTAEQFAFQYNVIST